MPKLKTLLLSTSEFEQLHHRLALTEPGSSLKILLPPETLSVLPLFAPTPPYLCGVGLYAHLGFQCCIQSCFSPSLKPSNFFKL